MLMLKKVNLQSNVIRPIAILAIAAIQCGTFAACAKHKPKVPAAASTITTGAGAPGTTGNPSSQNANPTPGGGVTGNPSAPTLNAPLPPGTSSFAASIEAMNLDVDATAGIVRLSFNHTASQATHSVGPLTAQISAASATGGISMETPPGLLGYTAHLTCSGTACATAALNITFTHPSEGGQATIQYSRTVPTASTVEAAGTPTGLQAHAAAALRTQGTINLVTTITRIENGASFFKVECRMPRGAIVPGHPAVEGGQRVIVSGQISPTSDVAIRYIENDTPVNGAPARGNVEEFAGAVTYTEANKTIHINFTGTNRISKLEFGDFRLH